MRVFVATTCTPDDRKTVATIRSLAGAGIDVTVGGDRFLGQAYYSRLCRGRTRYPHPARDLDGFVEALGNYLSRHDHDVLLPMNDYTTIAVADHRDKLEPLVNLCLPGSEALHQSLDKYQSRELARQIGIPTPATYALQGPEDLDEIGRMIDFPCVLKLRRGSGAVGLAFPQTFDELKKIYESDRQPVDLAFDYRNLLVQEYIPGELHEACLLFRQGELRAALTQRRIRMYPSRGGVGTVVVATDEPDLIEMSVTLLKSMKWHGPVQIEYMIDSRDGCTRLIEINGRFWGSLDLSIHAGVNFPLLACRIATEGDVEPILNYQKGLVFRWPIPFSLLDLLETREWFPSLRDFWGRQKDAISDLRLTDPVPVAAEIYFILHRLTARCLRAIRRRLR